MWAREIKDGDTPRGGPLESRRWIESDEIIAEQALKLPQTRHLFVGDRESDMLALKLSGSTLNVFSQIGLITLVGLITKHGILIAEFANQLREQGMDRFEAVKRSAALRLRPILMTTGAIPLALATAASAESRQQIGWVIVGGMSLSTLLTVFVVLTVYTLLSRERRLAVPLTQAAL